MTKRTAETPPARRANAKEVDAGEDTSAANHPGSTPQAKDTEGNTSGEAKSARPTKTKRADAAQEAKPARTKAERAEVAEEPKSTRPAKAKRVKVNEQSGTETEKSDGDAGLSPARPTGKDLVVRPEAPRNTALPSGTIRFAPPANNDVRIAAWNITSLKSAEQKGMMRYVSAEDAHVLFLTETKVNEVPDSAGLDSTYRYRYWGIGERKGYAGIAALSKIKPLDVTIGLPGFDSPCSKARAITLEFEKTIVIGTYAVNAGEKLKTLDNKVRWYDALRKYILSLLPRGKDLVWCGDLNVVESEIDLANATKKWDRTAGYTQTECDAQQELLAATGMKDAWRALHPDTIAYTYHSWRGMGRSKGLGWRLDSFIVTDKTMPRMRMCEIREEMYGPSDHVPVVADLAGPL